MTTQSEELIGVALPLEAIHTAPAREKSIRHGHLSAMNLRSARRALAPVRAVNHVAWRMDVPGLGWSSPIV